MCIKLILNSLERYCQEDTLKNLKIKNKVFKFFIIKSCQFQLNFSFLKQTSETDEWILLFISYV